MPPSDQSRNFLGCRPRGIPLVRTTHFSKHIYRHPTRNQWSCDWIIYCPTRCNEDTRAFELNVFFDKKEQCVLSLDPSSGFRDRSDILMTPLGGDIGVGTQTDGRELFSAAAHSVVWFYTMFTTGRSFVLLYNTTLLYLSRTILPYHNIPPCNTYHGLSPRITIYHPALLITNYEYFNAEESVHNVLMVYTCT